MGARPYDPSIGRFYAVDPIDGGSLNNYDYADQDPVNNYDLLGYSSFWHKVAKVAEAVYGTADTAIFGTATFGVASICIAGAPASFGLILAICGPPTAAGIASTGVLAYKNLIEWEKCLVCRIRPFDQRQEGSSKAIKNQVA